MEASFSALKCTYPQNQQLSRKRGQTLSTTDDTYAPLLMFLIFFSDEKGMFSSEISVIIRKKKECVDRLGLVNYC